MNAFIKRPLCLLVSLLASCAGRYRDYTINANGGSPGFGCDHPIVSWNRSEGFRHASARLRTANHPCLCALAPGEHLIVYATQGYVLPLTANLVQYWTAVLALPSDPPIGSVIQLKWADYGSEKELMPGEVAARARQALSGQQSPQPGSVAGQVVIVSRSEHQIKVRLHLSINLGPDTPGDNHQERGLLEREFDVVCQPVSTPSVLDAYPRGALEEVGVPRLGPHRHKRAT